MGEQQKASAAVTSSAAWIPATQNQQPQNLRADEYQAKELVAASHDDADLAQE